MTASTESAWLFADTAHPKFGQVVDNAVVQSAATFEARSAVALVKDGEEWTTAQRVATGDRDPWVDEKHSGPGRDPRLLTLRRTRAMKRFVNLRDAMEETTAPEASGDGPFSGPSAALELLPAILSAGAEFLPFFELWIRASGRWPTRRRDTARESS